MLTSTEDRVDLPVETHGAVKLMERDYQEGVTGKVTKGRNLDILLFPNRVVSGTEGREEEENEGAGAPPAGKFRMATFSSPRCGRSAHYSRCFHKPSAEPPAADQFPYSPKKQLERL
jgi:hypothetical protein